MEEAKLWVLEIGDNPHYTTKCLYIYGFEIKDNWENMIAKAETGEKYQLLGPFKNGKLYLSLFNTNGISEEEDKTMILSSIETIYIGVWEFLTTSLEYSQVQGIAVLREIDDVQYTKIKTKEQYELEQILKQIQEEEEEKKIDYVQEKLDFFHLVD